MIAVLLLSCLTQPVIAADICGTAIAAAEKARGTAPGLLAAIGVVESGRLDPVTRRRAPWPWTVTAQGIGTYYPTKAEAIRAVETLRARSINSIDVGCMQVNLLHHPEAFRTLEDAFDPAQNTLYAARFLKSLFARLGEWPKAAAAYHSLTPALGAQYSQLISAVWAGAPVPTVQEPNGDEIVRFPGGGQMRILRAGGSPGAPGRVAGFLTGP